MAARRNRLAVRARAFFGAVHQMSSVLRDPAISYWFCPDCDRVFRIQTTASMQLSECSLSEVLANKEKSDCRRYEERCGHCAEEGRQGRPTKPASGDLVESAVQRRMLENGPHSSTIADADKSHSQTCEGNGRSIRIDRLNSEGGENQTHPRETDDARPSRLHEFLLVHVSKLFPFGAGGQA